MEKEFQEGGMKSSESGKMHKDKALKTEKADKNCQLSSVEFLVKTMEKMDAKLMRTAEKKDMWKEEYAKLLNDLNNQKINSIPLNHTVSNDKLLSVINSMSIAPISYHIKY